MSNTDFSMKWWMVVMGLISILLNIKTSGQEGAVTT